VGGRRRGANSLIKLRKKHWYIPKNSEGASSDNEKWNVAFIEGPVVSGKSGGKNHLADSADEEESPEKYKQIVQLQINRKVVRLIRDKFTGSSETRSPVVRTVFCKRVLVAELLVLQNK